MKTKRLLLCLAVLPGSAIAAPIALSPGNFVYTQNFDVLATATNNNAATTMWTDDSTIPGWWFFRAGNTAGTPLGLAGAAFTYYVSDGTAPPQTAPLAHGFYSLGALGAADRTMGSCPTTNSGEISAIAIFQNTTAGQLKLTRVKFTGEAYRANNTANNRDSLFVWWKTGAAPTDLTTNLPIAAPSTNPTVFVSGTAPPATTTAPTSQYISGWNHLPEFNFVYFNAASSAVPVPPDTRAFDAAPATPVLVQAGEFIAIRWSNVNDGGTDAMLGFDDLELTFEPFAGCVVTASASGITRLPGADPASATDDSVSFAINATAVAGAPAGWIVPAGGPGAGASGAYGAPVTVTIPIANFDASGNTTVRVEDAGDAACFQNVSVTAPPFIQSVNALTAPQITFTLPSNGANSYTPPPGDQSEMGWSGGNGASNVQTQPDNGAFVGTAKYFRINGADTTFTTDPVNVSALAGQNLKGQIMLGFYSTSTSGFENTDFLNARIEVALDGDFSNTAAGNVLTQNFIDEPGVDTDLFDETIPVAATYMDLGVAGYPMADFVFHPFEQTVSIPAGAVAARARIIFMSGAGVTNSEHILLDNVRFSLASPGGDSDGDGMTDAYEDANGLNKNSNTDRDTDLDGDGQSNYREFLAGTGSNDATSTFRILSASLSDINEISLTWASVAGKTYQASVSSDLGDTSPWLTLGGTVTATGPTASAPPGLIVPPGLPRYFLRVEVVP